MSGCNLLYFNVIDALPKARSSLARGFAEGRFDHFI